MAIWGTSLPADVHMSSGSQTGYHFATFAHQFTYLRVLTAKIHHDRVPFIGQTLDTSTWKFHKVLISLALPGGIEPPFQP